MERELITCPECGRPAEILDRRVLQSTDGPVEHVKTHCVSGHWFFMEAAALAQPQRRPDAVEAGTRA
jgi:hypothetical protein